MRNLDKMKKTMLVMAASLFCSTSVWAEAELRTGVAYYMKNVATGLYLGGGNDWGTRASLIEHGLDVTLEDKGGGKYAIDTKIPNGDKHYLGLDGSGNSYVDAASYDWTLNKVGEDTYTIALNDGRLIGSDGSSIISLNLSDPNSAAAQWQFLSKDELVAGLVDATAENPVDATFYIVGQNFSRADNDRNAAWQGAPTIDGDNKNFSAEKWNTAFDVYQVLTGLPDGFYELSAQAYYRAGNGGSTNMAQNAYIYANGSKTQVLNINSEAGNSAFDGIGTTVEIPNMGKVPDDRVAASLAFLSGAYADNKVIGRVVDGTLRIGIKNETVIGGDWTCFDNFELAYLGGDAELAAAVDSLDKLLAEAKAWQAELNPEDQGMHAPMLEMLGQMIPQVQEMIDAASNNTVAGVEEMQFSVYSFLGTYKPMVAKYDAGMAATAAADEAQALYDSYENPVDNAGLVKQIESVREGANLLNDWWEPVSIEELAERVAALNAAKELFIMQNVPAPAVEIVNVLGKHRLVALSNDHVVATEIFYSFDKAMTEPAIYTAPFYVSETTTVYAYAQYIGEDRVRYESKVVAVEIEAGTEIALNAPVIEETEEGIVITSDQSDVLGAPTDSIEYAFYPLVGTDNYSAVPSVSGIYESALTGLDNGKLVVKAVAFGYVAAESTLIIGGFMDVAGGTAYGIKEVVNGLANSPADIYDVTGRLVKSGATSLEGLKKGIYLIRGKKVAIMK